MANVNFVELDLETLPDDFGLSDSKIEMNSVRAVNTVARSVRTEGARRIRGEVNLQPSYINQNLNLDKRATRADMSAEITATFRSISLARFAKGGATAASRKRANQSGKVTVEVARGISKDFKGAFFFKGRTGADYGDLGEGNTLLAIRLKPGQTLRNRKIMSKTWRGLTFLYGPSIDQMFRVYMPEMIPETEDKLSTEFLRLLDQELKGTFND